MLLNFQLRLTVALSSVRNRQKSTKNLAARPFMVQDHAAQNASNARTSKNWTRTSAISREENTQLVKCCRVIRPTASVAKRVSAQGCRKYLLIRTFWSKQTKIFHFVDKRTSLPDLCAQTVTAAFRASKCPAA
jgi:hypothetical protein